jgi:hypothetical protein
MEMEWKVRTIALTVVLGAASAAVWCPAAERPQAEEKGFVLRATGTGLPPRGAANPAQAQLMARRASEVVALRNLAALATGKTVEGDPRTNRTWVKAFIRGFRVIERRENPDGSFTTVVELPISDVGGNFRGAVSKADLLEARLRQLETEVAALRGVLDDTVTDLAIAQVAREAAERENRFLRKEIERLADELARAGAPADEE